MTTQAVTGAVFGSGATGGRSYSVTATDGQFNRAIDTIGSAQLGFAQTGQVVTHVQVTYAAGAAYWRIRNSVSQVTLRQGFGFKVGAGGPSPGSGAIVPYQIQQDDVLEVYTQAVPT